MNSPEFQGIAAAEHWETAYKTFAKNDPETKVSCETTEDFFKQVGLHPRIFERDTGRLWPCFAVLLVKIFSGSNCDTDHNGKKDLHPKGSLMEFINAVKMSGVLVSMFENVERMWHHPNVSLIKKIVLEHIWAGWKVHIQLSCAHVFCDP